MGRLNEAEGCKWSAARGAYPERQMAAAVPRIGAGLLDALAFLPSTVILGGVFGASAGPAGLAPPVTVLMSITVFSGATQFAALPLWPEGAGVVVLSALALSLRFSLITASMAPLLLGSPRAVRAALAYCVTDENYALAVTRQRGRLDPGYLIGSWIPLYFGWLAGTVVGVLLGARVPSEWLGPLTAVFPLVFLVLTVLLCTSLPLAVVALLGGVLSVVGASILPNGWNIIAAGLVASLLGLPLERRFGTRPKRAAV
jgi:predicted branched-subunit amino acid permease